MSTSLRLSTHVRKRIAKAARAASQTPHGFMIQAIEEKLEADELHQQMVAEAEARLAKMKKTNTGIPADEVFAYFRRRTAGRPAGRPRPRALQ